MTVPVVLAPVGVGAQRVADDPDGPLHLGVGVLLVVLSRANDQAPADPLDESGKHLERGVVGPPPERREILRRTACRCRE